MHLLVRRIGKEGGQCYLDNDRLGYMIKQSAKDPNEINGNKDGVNVVKE